MSLDELIRAFGERIGQELTVEDHVVTLGVDDMTVTVQEVVETGVIATFGEIGEPPPQGLEKLFSAMLEANHLFAGTAGSTISRDPETGRFFLCRVDAAAATDVDGFLSALERFINTLETWRRILADYRPEEPAPSADGEGPGAPVPGGFMRI